MVAMGRLTRTNYRRQSSQCRFPEFLAYVKASVDNTGGTFLYYTAISQIFCGVPLMNFIPRYWQIASDGLVPHYLSISCHQGSLIYFRGYTLSCESAAEHLEFVNPSMDSTFQIILDPIITSIGGLLGDINI
jgi:hypothetical protein